VEVSVPPVGVPPDSFLHREEKLRTQDGERIYTWDGLHGEAEIFNRRGKHIGVADALTGETIKPAEKGRAIDV
jgi:putative cytotoxic protein